MNKVLLVGRITRDPDLRYTPSNIPTVSFTVAVDRGFKDQNGQRQADFINCVAWRSQAEFIGRYIKKGNMLSVEGRIQSRSYQNQQGVMQYVTEVICDAVENLTPRPANNDSYNQVNNYNDRGNYNQPSYQQPSYDVNINPGIVDDSDLPF